MDLSSATRRGRKHRALKAVVTSTEAEATTDPHLQQCTGAQRYAQLQRMQAVAIGNGPLAPDVGCLAHCAIPRARHVAQDAIE
jgi:hypothetical protein